MKNKIIIVSLCATFLFVFAACKNSPKANAGEQKTEETVQPDEVVVEETVVEIPVLKDADAQKFVKDYAAFVEEYIDAYTTNDPQKIKKVTPQAEKFANKTNEIVAKLTRTPEEYQKFADFMQKMADKLIKVQKGG